MNSQMPRRTFLRGLGTALALPYLDAMAPGSLWAHSTGTTLPTRLAYLFIPNGVHQPDWAPTGEGNNWQPSRILEPLAAVRDDILVVSGLAHGNARALGDGPGDHARSAACYLTGAHPVKTAGDDIHNGTSVDQTAAALAGGDTLIPSLQMGTEGGRQSGNCDSGYSCAYSSTISWSAAETPLLHETRARALFERMFLRGPAGETTRARRERLAKRSSIIDYVGADAKRLARQLGKSDRQRIDEYLTGIRDIEGRIDRLEQLEALEKKEGVEFDFSSGAPKNIREHIRLMHELMLLAFRLDMTRIVTFMWANEGSNRSYPHLEIREGHHTLTHHKGAEKQVDMVRRINRWQMEELAFLVERMGQIPDGEGSLLDSTILIHGSAIGDGNSHNHHDLPVIIAGRGNGAIDPGRHLIAPKNTPMSNLLLSTLHAIGSDAPRHGDSSGPLGGLTL